MDFLTFDLDEVAGGVPTVVAMASTTAARHAAAMQEVRQVLTWAWEQFPTGHGPIDDGMDWDHDLQVTIEEGGWHTVTLTLSGSAAFIESLWAAFGSADD